MADDNIPIYVRARRFIISKFTNVAIIERGTRSLFLRHSEKSKMEKIKFYVSSPRGRQQELEEIKIKDEANL